jgi:DNA polymerase
MGYDADLMAPENWEAAFAALDWQVELGVSDWVLDTPVDRFALPERLERMAPARAAGGAAQVTAPMAVADPVAEAAALAGRASSLEVLREALLTYEHCELKKGARNLVFGAGHPQARVLVLGEAPSSEEDREGRPFVGRSGQLLDRMFAAIGLGRASPDPATALYVMNALPWRPPADRDPEPRELAMMQPFLARQIALVDPDVIVAMGNLACKLLFDQTGILRLRGTWAEALGKPVLPMIPPAYLLRQPLAKREAWADLLSLKARL